MNAFAGRVVLLTGAGGGLGREFARQLLAAGADLILSSHNPQRLKAAAAGARSDLVSSIPKSSHI